MNQVGSRSTAVQLLCNLINFKENIQAARSAADQALPDFGFHALAKSSPSRQYFVAEFQCIQGLSHDIFVSKEQSILDVSRKQCLRRDLWDIRPTRSWELHSTIMKRKRYCDEPR